jgi:broad specificity phosphatase PhoE
MGDDVRGTPVLEAASTPSTGRGLGQAVGSIVLARHGRPKGDRTVKITWREYVDWWRQYDIDGLAPDQAPPANLVAQAAAADTIFASSLARAIETARAAAPGRELIVDPVFVEAPLPPPPMPGRRTPRAWGVWARVAWWLGRAAGGESRQMAEVRAEAAVATVTARALRGENVLLCGHGWFNRMMRPVLLRQGWRCVEDHGDTYWSYRRYIKTR